MPTLSGKGQVSSDVFLFRLTWLPSLHHSPQGTFQPQKPRHWLHPGHSTSSGMEINHHFLPSKQPKCLKSPSVGRSPQDTWQLLRPLSVPCAGQTWPLNLQTDLKQGRSALGSPGDRLFLGTLSHTSSSCLLTA